MKIIVAVDFSDHSAPILVEAQKWARLTAAEVWLVHVEEPYSDLVGDGTEFIGTTSSFGVGLNDPKLAASDSEIKTRRDADAVRLREGHARLQREAKEIRDQGVNITALLLSGSTVETILLEADKRQVDLIIVGSHGHGMMHLLLLGSVSEGVLRHAKCPVLVVPTHTL